MNIVYDRLAMEYGDGDFYMVEIQKTVWEIPQRYQNLKSIGSGTYGCVCSADDTQTASGGGRLNRVAIKKLNRPFQSSIHAKRTYREMKLLRTLTHENVIDLLDVFTPDPAIEELTDVYLVSTLMVTDLEKILKKQRMLNDQIKLIVYQILRALKYIHSAGVIHRDLKPSNIAIDDKSNIKIIDFGLARHRESEMTGYVATRWYRAPEIMLNWMHYDKTVDIWSLGCIMAEMILARPLFSGDDDIDQLTRIMAVLGTPTEDFLRKIESSEARDYIRRMPRVASQDFGRLFFNVRDADAVRLLQHTLQLDPAHRPTAEWLLRESPYMRDQHRDDDEPVMVGGSVDLDDEDLESILDVYSWQKKIWNEISDFRSQSAAPTS